MIRFQLMAAALLVSLAGCGGKAKPTEASSPKPGTTDEAVRPSAPTPPAGSGTPSIGMPKAPGMLEPTLLAPNAPAQQRAEQVIKELGNASVKPGPLPAELLKHFSPAFLKIIGKPLLTEADKKLGYSEDAASAWLKRAGTRLIGLGPPTGYGSPVSAVLIGTFGNGTGHFLLRMTFTDAWIVDWFSLGTIAATPEGSYQDFVVLAFLDALTSQTASKEDRQLLLGGFISTKLKQTWAEAFEGDKTRGFDYSPSLLGERIDEFGKGVTGYSRKRVSDGTFKIELMKGKLMTTYTLKLVKGTTSSEWLVEEFSKQ